MLTPASDRLRSLRPRRRESQWLLILVWLLSSSTEAADVTLRAKVGTHEIVLPAGYHGLNYFPDEPISIINENPYQVLMTAGNETWLLQGPTLGTVVPVKPVLRPGAQHEYDNGYSGVTSTYYDKKRKQLLAFYHAEDYVGMPKVSYNNQLQGAYWSVGMAILDDGSTAFVKAGQTLSPSVKKADVTHEHQGIGDVCVVADSTETYLYAYFTDLTRKKHSEPAKIGMARCSIADGGRPGRWYKYHNGDFTEKGLGGLEGPVVLPPAAFPCDVFAPHVTYMREMKQYVMVCNVMVYSDHEKRQAVKGGIYFCFSDDGIKWSEPTSLVTGHPVPYQGREYVAHPHLMITQATANTARGVLLYCYTPRWGTSAPNQPHHLAKRSITISMEMANTLGTAVTSASTSLEHGDVLIELRRTAKSVKANRNGDPTDIDLTDVPLTDLHLTQIATLSSVRRLTLPNTKLNDAGLQKLATLTNLTSLGMWQTRVTGDGLRHVSRLTNLTYLSVEGNGRIDDDGLKHLAKLSKLSWLGLSYTGVTDEGVQHLANLPSLNRLDLAHTKLTDRGLDQLTRITSLKTLTVTGTKVTDAGVAKFKRALPNSNVIR